MRNYTSESAGGDGTNNHTIPPKDPKRASPIAICGMALRLPGGLESPQQFWDFLVNKGDARGRVPKSRYNISAYYSRSGRPGTIGTEHGYFLSEDLQLGALDAGRFSISRAELECADPQQRRMLEVVQECLDDAGEVGFRGARVGCYMGSYGEDWLEMQNRDPQQSGIYRLDGYGDFMLSNRISYEMDLRGPSMTVRTACSSALVGLHEACLAIQQGHCKSAVVGGANLIMAPGAMASMTEKGVLSPDGSCKTFSADANGYARGEAVTAIYIKPLDAAVRDGNPIRAVIRSCMSNNDGKTPGISCPSTESQVAMIRDTYREAGITDFSQTAFVECHGTGTAVGDPIEANAVARVFGDSGVFIGSVKPNLGHSEGASGITSVIKAVLALENRTIPPNIKFSSPNPAIPFRERRLAVPLEPTPWPESKSERVSVNSFGIGGSNAHVVLDSARSFNLPAPAAAARAAAATKADPRLAAGPHLLLMSAASAASLQQMSLNLQAWLTDEKHGPFSGQKQLLLQDVAYTLAHRREHLSHRAFVVARRDQPGVASSPGKKANTARPPNLVMVFSGQGAQWARMGRELLLRSDMCFQSSIEALDRCLQDAQLGSSDVCHGTATGVASKASHPWSLEEELLKPARTSRVQEAEFSQPLCTAVQIALVDLFASVGVEPVAVVGHSSGEIAAAYATGALTAREAIITAWQRGQAARSQTRPGAMAAVSLGWEQVKTFLPTSEPPGVVVACENSPRSVTLSGDAIDVEATVSKIKQAHPDVTARLLKVDKAYHSYHMTEVGHEYCSSMEKVLAAGKRPLKPYFSTVTGRLEEGVLDAAYWRKNLESPVLFKSAVSLVLQNIDNVAFLEIGPHSTLAGPLRQITIAWQDATGKTTTSPPYISALARSEDSAESFLTATGKLFELGVPVDLGALIPAGTCLPDLPRYQWDHSGGDHWRESRMSHEWRCREHAAHPLLGVRQLESSSLEPSWRNMLHVDKVPWLRDHRIEGLLIFPCAGYVAMAGEAITQASARTASFSLRNVVISSALVINEGAPVELVTTLRPYRLTDSLDSQWWEFAISSHNGHVWTKHITGQVSASDVDVHVNEDDTTAMGSAPLPRAVEAEKYYSILDRAGLQFGPHFRRPADIRTGTTQQLATARVATTTTDSSPEDEDDYHLHPTAVDACIQTLFLAALKGRLDAKHCRAVPTKIKKLSMRRPVDRMEDSKTIVSASATVTAGSGDIVGLAQQCVVDGRVVLHMEGMTISPLEEAEDAGGSGGGGGGLDFVGSDGLRTTARTLWGPHVDFLDAAKLIRPSIPRHLYAPTLDELTLLAQIYAQRRMAESSGSRGGLPHMVKYRSWVDTQVQQHMQHSGLGVGNEDDSCATAALQGLGDAALTGKMADIVSRLSDTPVAACATAVQKVALNMSGLYVGDTEALEILLADDTLTQVYIATDACDRSEFIRHLAHSKPNLRILEIGAGTGASTMSMLKHLVLPGADGRDGPGGHPLYSRYTFTDISSAFFVSAKERFKGRPNIEYRTLDISKDPAGQGFGAADRYDLVIATNVLHATPRLGETLRNVQCLLAPGSRLLLHEIYSRSTWPNFVFGTLPGWWLGEGDGRPQQPCVDPARWEEELKRSGFSGLDALVFDADEPYQLNAIMVAKPRLQLAGEERSGKGNKNVTILCDDDDDDQERNSNNNSNRKPEDSFASDLLVQQLELQGYKVSRRKLSDKLPVGPLDDIISLLDLGPRGPFFQSISDFRFAAFQRLLEKLASSSSPSSSSSAAGDGRRPCMLWVTRPCQVRCRDPGYAQIIGAARTIRTEMLLDLATCEVDDVVGGCAASSSPSPSPSLGRVVDVFTRFRERGSEVQDDSSLHPDYEFAIVDGTVVVGRAYPFSLADDHQVLLSAAEEGGGGAAGLSLGMTRPGRLATMEWYPREARELQGDEVEVEVHAIGLNFKDVLCALGVVPFPKGGLGSESSGVVRRVGPEVKDLCVGDRVFLMADGSFATHVIGIERMCERIPATLPFEEAVTMPAVFTTTVAALLNIGRLEKGQTVLIHSACGGVGLAAIQLARMVQAEIYATVGSEDKIKYLTDTVGLPRNRIFNSRDSSFVQGLMRETNGRGVDLALNSLSGELLHATWHSVAEFGRMVEIGKRDILGGGKLDMDVFLTNRGYTCFCLDHLAQNRPAAFKDLLRWVRRHLEDGAIQPIPRARVFDASSLQEALRYMQKGQHIGKIVISMRDAEGAVKINTAPVKPAPKLQLDSSASYMLVGGLGGLGRAVSRHLVDHGARRLVFLSRGAGSRPGDADLSRELESMGCEVILVRGSVTDAADVARAVQQAPNLRGVMQCSMVLSDQGFPRMTLDEWNTAVAPKVTGTWNLHNATVSAGADLDFFLLFSSMSGLTGQAGQANYAGANTFLDAFVQFRNSLGLAASAIDIGAVQDVGYVSQDPALLKRMMLASAHGITEPELLEALTAAMLSGPRPRCSSKAPRGTPAKETAFEDRNTFVLGLGTKIPLSSPDSRAFWRRDRRMAVYHNSSRAAVGDGASNSDGLKAFLARAKSDAALLKAPDTAALLAREVGRKLFSFLLRPEEELNTSVPLSQLGMDSLVGVEMRSWWRQAFGFDITVLELLGAGNLSALGSHAAEGLYKVLHGKS